MCLRWLPKSFIGERWSQERRRERDLNIINNEVQRLHLVTKDRGVCASHKHVYGGSRQTSCNHRVSSLSINWPSPTWLSGLTAHNWDLNYRQWGNWNQRLNTRSLIVSDRQWSSVIPSGTLLWLIHLSPKVICLCSCCSEIECTSKCRILCKCFNVDCVDEMELWGEE